MKWVVRGILLLLFAGGAYWVWTVIFPPPDKVIRKRLGELQQIASFDSREAPFAKLTNAKRFSMFFTSDVKIIVDLPEQRGVLQGRDELFQRAVGVRNALTGLDVKFLDINVGLGSDRASALVNLTATAKIPGEKDFMVQEMELAMGKEGGQWLIRQVKTVRTLK
jgi:hypothetical protein